MEEIIKKLIKKHFPDRVWEKGINGWYSRPTDPLDDFTRREWVLKHYGEQLEAVK